MAQSGPAAREAAYDTIRQVAESIPGGEKLIPAVDQHGRPNTPPQDRKKKKQSSSSGDADSHSSGAATPSSSKQQQQQQQQSQPNGKYRQQDSNGRDGAEGGRSSSQSQSQSPIESSDDEHISRIVNREEGSEHNDRQRSLTVAFMKCDEIHESAKEVHGGYEDVIHNLFEPILKERTQASKIQDKSRLELRTLVFDARKREYPSERQLRTTIDAVVISGSFQDGASEDTRWILRLAGFLIKLYDEFPRIRIIGICFGLQIIARAFGPNRIVMNPKGHEIGSTKLHLTELGKRILHPPHEVGHEGHEGGAGREARDHIMLQQVHGDIVEGEVPQDFELLAWSDQTPIQAIAHLYPADAEIPKFLHTTLAEETEAGPPSPWNRVHVFGIQGHPEWDESIILPIIDAYEEKGTLTSQQADEARKRTRLEHDGRNVGRALLAVLGFV
ncbi:uncharacterized protein PFL1_06599 [Pseudozyma flocculosa PF-1]|uniref:Glutamine amidotransferase domain-containing protein n=2 Tax=Pseudozyma flocculosa TaxID=84751 RepID=A0A5C3F7U1_9BASI|nr:uncharacterized protein PFL1_06599 [Pseudozyma flocculosa PF-1]EPQ25925.1 hypothetical protein PFL1_06599 [Pseudozyma flocculosa PF-1]SPO40574.1 uncharacterized protein PSFLO_06056 [Pseudozyma flocculosa]